MKFSRKIVKIVKSESVVINDLSAKEQKDFLKKNPQFEKYVVYEDDLQGSEDNDEVQSEPKQRKRRKRNAESD